MRQQAPTPPVVLQLETSGEDIVIATVTSTISGESDTVTWVCAEVVADHPPYVVVVGGVSVELHGLYVPPEAIPPEASVPGTPGSSRSGSWRQRPQRSSSSERASLRSSTSMSQTCTTSKGASRTYGDAPGDAALNQHYLDGDVALKNFPFNRAGLDVNDEGGHGRSSATRRPARRSSAPGCCSRTTSAATTRTVPSSQTSSTGRLRQTALQRERGDGPCDVLHADDGLIGIRNIASVSSFIFCVDGFNRVKIDSSKMVISTTLS